MRISIKEDLLRNKLNDNSCSELNKWRVYWFDCVASTMDEASLLAEDLENDTIGVVIADTQTAGRGRSGREWNSGDGNLYLTLVIRCEKLPKNCGGFSLVVGNCIMAVLGIDGIGLKWPNDVMTKSGKKLAGVLIETKRVKNGYAIMVGIGLDLKTAPVPEAISLEDLGVFDFKLEEVAANLSLELANSWHKFCEVGFGEFRDKWLANAFCLKKEIRVRTPHGFLNGIFEGVDQTGALLLKTGGKLTKVLSGDLLSERF
ncbi:MAG: biotin--[acetyl-CoA-carboxylase] ligase [Bdellovibrionota bacterium]